MMPVGSAASLAGSSVTVMGLGLFGGGSGVARWLVRQGARVTVTDLRDERVLAPALEDLAALPLRLVLGGHEEPDFARTDLVVANPAVPPTSPWLAIARHSGVPVTSEIGLFLERCPARAAAISGTQGKSSTASFLAELCRGALDPDGGRTYLGGNLGGSLLDELDSMTEQDRVVIELSSYQLEALASFPFRPLSVAVLTNVLADHLERHGSVAEYRRAKLRLLELLQPGGAAVLPREPAQVAMAPLPAGARRIVVGLGSATEGLALIGDRFLLDGEVLGRADELRFRGRFQAENALLALGAAHLLGAPAQALRTAVPRLAPPPHRLQDLGTRAGRRVIDNGVSTTPDSTLSALREVGGACVLLVGGRAKAGLGFEELASELAARDAIAVVFGGDRAQVSRALARAGVRVFVVTSLAEAVRAAFERSTPGTTVLFSPACASFDAHANFRERALQFQAELPPLDASQDSPTSSEPAAERAR